MHCSQLLSLGRSLTCSAGNSAKKNVSLMTLTSSGMWAGKSIVRSHWPWKKKTVEYPSGANMLRMCCCCFLAENHENSEVSTEFKPGQKFCNNRETRKTSARWPNDCFYGRVGKQQIYFGFIWLLYWGTLISIWLIDDSFLSIPLLHILRTNSYFTLSVMFLLLDFFSECYCFISL